MQMLLRCGDCGCCMNRCRCYTTRKVAVAPSMTVTALLLVILIVAVHVTTATASTTQPKYLLVGVSGGLQDGFPERFKMDYIDVDVDGNENTIPAIYIGKTIIRGYKAYLDVMEKGYRQYIKEPGQPLINSNVFATGCYAHANEYWFYMIDARQVLFVLNNEPRFLSITPDTGLVNLHLLSSTSNSSLLLPQHLIEEYSTMHLFLDEYMKQLQIAAKVEIETEYIAVPLVTAVYYNKFSHVESPIVHTLPDGTEITNFPDSLAKWANVSSIDRRAVLDLQCTVNTTKVDDTICTNETMTVAKQSEQRFWDGIRTAVRNAEKQRAQGTFPKPSYVPNDTCPSKNRKTRFGVGPNTIRINQAFTQTDFYQLVHQMNYEIDLTKKRIVPVVRTEEVVSTNNNDEPVKEEL